MKLALPRICPCKCIYLDANRLGGLTRAREADRRVGPGPRQGGAPFPWQQTKVARTPEPVNRKPAWKPFILPVIVLALVGRTDEQRSLHEGIGRPSAAGGAGSGPPWKSAPRSSSPRHCGNRTNAAATAPRAAARARHDCWSARPPRRRQRSTAPAGPAAGARTSAGSWHRGSACRGPKSPTVPAPEASSAHPSVLGCSHRLGTERQCERRTSSVQPASSKAPATMEPNPDVLRRRGKRWRRFSPARIHEGKNREATAAFRSLFP